MISMSEFDPADYPKSNLLIIILAALTGALVGNSINPNLVLPGLCFGIAGGIYLAYQPRLGDRAAAGELERSDIECRCGEQMLIDRGGFSEAVHCPECGREGVRGPEHRIISRLRSNGDDENR